MNYGGNNIFGQRFDNQSNPVGVEFQINTPTAFSISSPTVAGLRDGGFVVAWTITKQADGIYFQRFDSSGNKVGTETEVKYEGTNVQNRYANVAAFANGGFVISWRRDVYDSTTNLWPSDIMLQRYDSTGAKFGSEVAVTETQNVFEWNPTISIFSNDSFIIVFLRTTKNSPLVNEMYAQRFDSSSNKVGNVFALNPNRNYNVVGKTEILTLNGGDFVVVWPEDGGRDGDYMGVFAKVYDASGTALSNDFQVNTFFTGIQSSPSITELSDGFLITWTGVGDINILPYPYNIFAQRFSIPNFGLDLLVGLQSNASHLNVLKDVSTDLGKAELDLLVGLDVNAGDLNVMKDVNPALNSSQLSRLVGLKADADALNGLSVSSSELNLIHDLTPVYTSETSEIYSGSSCSDATDCASKCTADGNCLGYSLVSILVQQLALGKEFTCSLFNNGLVKCWGKGDEGRLGYGNTNNRGDGPVEMGTNLPTVDLGTGKLVKQIHSGHTHRCSLLNDGNIKCWGRADFGQLGNGNSNNHVQR